MKTSLPMITLLALFGCGGDETLSAYAITDKTYRLTELDGVPPSTTVTLRLGPNGKMAGQAPCNRFTAISDTPYPWLRIDAVAATKMACPDLAEEAAFFSALRSMTLVEASGPLMVFSNDAGQELVFEIEESATDP